MDYRSQRRIVAITGIVIAFLGLTGTIWGVLNNNGLIQLGGLLLLLVAYICTLIINRIKKKEQAASKLE